MLRTLLLLPLLALAACKGADAPATEAMAPPRPVLVQRVAFADRRPERRFVATVRPRVEADLGFRVGGKVARRLVDVGETVKAGQPLATLDDVDFHLQTEQALAEETAAAAALKEGEADLRRAETLSGQGWTATSAADRQRTATAEARGRLLRAERALTLARNASSYAVLAADGDGVVTATGVESGQVVTPGQLAVRIAHTEEREAVVAIPEIFMDQVRGGRASLSLWSSPDRAYPATLRELSPSADSATRTFLARFSLPAADDAVRIGMTGTLTLAMGSAAEKVVRLPLSALFDAGKGSAVWVVDADGRPAAKPVTVAAYGSRDVLVAGGLVDGDAVVTLGVQKLDPGQRVRTVDALRF